MVWSTCAHDADSMFDGTLSTRSLSSTDLQGSFSIDLSEPEADPYYIRDTELPMSRRYQPNYSYHRDSLLYPRRRRYTRPSARSPYETHRRRPRLRSIGLRRNDSFALTNSVFEAYDKIGELLKHTTGGRQRPRLQIREDIPAWIGNSIPHYPSTAAATRLPSSIIRACILGVILGATGMFAVLVASAVLTSSCKE
jgi:hypothetical protein